MKYQPNDEVWFYNNSPDGYNDKGIVLDYYLHEDTTYYIIKVELSEGNYELVMRTEERL